MGDSIKNYEKDNVEGKVDNSESEDLTTSSSIEESLKDLPEVLSFIQRLQDCILRQRNLILRLYDKLKEPQNKSTKDASTQTSEDEIVEFSYNDVSENLVDDIKRAAENAVHQTGFVYEETSGMYYDYSTGYYYNAEQGLYYDGNSGIYYYFDESSKSFQFHSQIAPSSLPSLEECCTSSGEVLKKRNQDLEEAAQKIPKKIKLDIKEEGECSESSSDSENELNELHNGDESMSTCDTGKNIVESEDCKVIPNIVKPNLHDDEVANAWPPCLRVVVTQTGLDNLEVGSLFIVTCTGGTVGREGDHAIIIPDISISKHHAKVSFNEEEKCYNIVDLGSRNGTFVDGQRISVALRESEPVALRHGTEIRLGSTHLECHLHSGRDTCDQCEPGCALRRHKENLEQTDKDHETREARHRSELRRLRKRFGLDKLSAKEAGPSLAPGYQDRAEERRKTVGSHDHHAKTETASVHQSIQSSNKGFKMLSKMGWTKGQSLGKDSTKGITEPVTVEQRADKVGLGSEAASLPPPDPKAKKKADLWKKAQERFQALGD